MAQVTPSGTRPSGGWLESRAARSSGRPRRRPYITLISFLGGQFRGHMPGILAGLCSGGCALIHDDRGGPLDKQVGTHEVGP